MCPGIRRGCCDTCSGAWWRGTSHAAAVLERHNNPFTPRARIHNHSDEKLCQHTGPYRLGRLGTRGAGTKTRTAKGDASWGCERPTRFGACLGDPDADVQVMLVETCPEGCRCCHHHARTLSVQHRLSAALTHLNTPSPQPHLPSVRARCPSSLTPPRPTLPAPVCSVTRSIPPCHVRHSHVNT